MSMRMKSLFAAFGLSLALWGIVIKGAIALYPYGASTAQSAPVWTAELNESSLPSASYTR